MFDDSCPWSLCICVVHSCISLEIRFVQYLCLESYRTVLQRTQFICKICINRSGIYDFFSQTVIILFLLKIIHTKFYLDTFKHIGNHLCVTTYRDSLIQRIEVVVIKSQTHRQTADDK